MILVCSLLVFMSIYSFRRHQFTTKRNWLKKCFADVVSDIILCESPEELEVAISKVDNNVKTALKFRYGRKVLLKEIIHTKANFTGHAADNLVWLYERWSFHQDSLARFASDKWHIKAKGIQQLAEMRQTRFLKRIYRDTDHPNALVRKEAQVAIVQLIGFEGLRFLRFIQYPLTQWQQLCLLHQLNEQDINVKSIEEWLRSANETVVEFALRLIEKYKCFTLQNLIIDLLNSPNQNIVSQAIQTLNEIADEDTATLLIPYFDMLAGIHQHELLQIIVNNIQPEQHSFLLDLSTSTDPLICNTALKALQKFHVQFIGKKQRTNTGVYLLPVPEKDVI